MNPGTGSTSEQRSGWYRFGWRPARWLASWSVKLPAQLVVWIYRATVWTGRESWHALNSVFRPSWWRLQLDALRNLQGAPVLHLRKWFLVFLALLIVIPLITGNIAAIFVGPGGAEDEKRMIALLEDGQERWADPDWQATATREFAGFDIHAVLYENGTELYRSTPDPLASLDDPGDIRHLQFGDVSIERTAYIYGDPWSTFSYNYLLVPVVVIGSIIVIVAGFAVFVGRSIIQPLGATSRSAAAVAGGNLEIDLPDSYVREVADLNAAFEGMAGQLKQTLEREAELEEQRRLIVGAVAHDLRTPLFSLRGSLEAISTGVASSAEKREQYLQIAQQKADALERLISELFEFARGEAAMSSSELETVAIEPMLHRTVESFQPRANDQAITLAVRSDCPQSSAQINPHQLERALDNLIDNALRFTPAQGDVHVRCVQEEDAIQILVSDTGPGIPENALNQIFEPLYRAESSRNPATGGLGLGLTIARNIFLVHGGNLQARNLPDGGAEFIGTLPAIEACGTQLS